MGKDAKRDIVAIVLLAVVISTVILVMWMNKMSDHTSEIARFTDASERLSAFVSNYDSLTPLELMTAELDPQTFIDAAAYAPDHGTANELRYVAELIARYNDGASVEVLQEASELLHEIIPHIRETLQMNNPAQ